MLRMADNPELPITEGNPLLAAVIQSNSERLYRLRQQSLDMDVTRAMVSFLIEELYPDPSVRQEFELRFQNHLAALLAEGEAQAPIIAQQMREQQEAARLAVPPAAGAGLIVPGQ